MTTIVKCNQRTARDAMIPQRLPFQASALSGGTDTDQIGKLPEPYRTSYKVAEAAGEIAYVVRSYATPIAWVLTSGEVVVPAARYSVTTSCHQGITRFALRAETPAYRRDDLAVPVGSFGPRVGW